MRGDFWSRRREAVAREAKIDNAAIVAAEDAEREAALAEKTDEQLLAEAGFLAPEELDSAEAVREFLRSTLPQRLKTRALRRLWRLNPVLANVDGLVDYGEDFTDSAKIIENMQTAYRVGKGMLKHIEELARQAEAADNDASIDDVVEDPEVIESPVEIADVEVAEPPSHPEPAYQAEDERQPAPRRRMTFTFDEQRTG